GCCCKFNICQLDVCAILHMEIGLGRVIWRCNGRKWCFLVDDMYLVLIGGKVEGGRVNFKADEGYREVGFD
ncbi:hypothetical protein, partial [Bacillus pumilus]|uniref:hypothetical protein n=1 Tax=Bacillus pumilus TaxID=1408 RepID=UPI001C92C507